MIGLDASPLAGPPCGVRRMVEGWIAGFASIPSTPSVRCLEGRSRGALARAARAAGVTVFLSPWQAFPRLDVPVVVTVHELPFVRWGPVEGRLRAAIHRHWLRRDVREAAAIVVPSDATRRDVLSLHPEAARRVHVVPHAFYAAPWRAAAAVRAGPTSDGRPLAVVVGASSRRKGLDVLEKAVPLAGDVRWLLVGRPSRADAHRLGKVGVELHASVDDAALRSLVAGAAVLVHPSLSEGFGFTPLEAMAAGVPVVATTGGSVPEVTGDAALLVEPGDAGALAAGVRRVLDDVALRTRLIASGNVRADAFPPERTATRLLDVLAAAEAGVS